MINLIAKIREKLDVYAEAYIKRELVEKILDKFAPNYSVSQLCDMELLIPIKRGKWYINSKTRKYINPFVVGDLYMWDELYMFGWMMMYNRYGISDQVAEWYTIYNTKISGKKIIWPAKFIFVRQRESFFYGFKKEKFENYSYKVMSNERAFIQALKEKKEFYTIPYKIDCLKLKKLAEKNTSKIINNKIEELCILKK